MDHDVEVFYDGECPLCMREIRMLQRLDQAGRIQFTDIMGAAFEPTAYGKTIQEFMQKILGRLPDGAWIEGVEVFRRLYAAVGFRRAVWVSRLPVIAQLLALGYHLFAKNRLRMTGRCMPGAACAWKPSSANDRAA